MAIRHVTFAELPVTDQDRALAFYVQQLGFEVATDSGYQQGARWIELRIPGGQTNILLSLVDEIVQRKEPRLALTVDDVRESHRLLADKGITFTQEPTQAPWQPGQVFALFLDSEGNVVMLGEREAS